MSSLNLNIAGRLWLGFAAICLVLVAAVAYTSVTLSSVTEIAQRVTSQRAPTANASADLTAQMNGSLAILRGYLLTGNEKLKAERAATWTNIGALSSDMDELAKGFTKPENRERWAAARDLFGKLRAAQDKAEALAFTPDAFPATKILTDDAAPRAKILTGAITRMIEDEAKQAATPERKALLKSMADVRGNFGLALANIRAFLLSGDQQFRQDFDQRWAAVQKALAAVKGQQMLFSGEQQSAFAEFAKTLAEFEPMPAKMFDIRDSDGWNMPVKILATEAAPVANQILDVLVGTLQPDGSRSGGLKDSQRQLMTADTQDLTSSVGFLAIVEWILLAVGLALGGAIAFFTARSIVPAVHNITESMTRLAKGDDAITFPQSFSRDEIGRMWEAMVALTATVREAFQLGEVARQLPVNLLMADARDNFKISYVNNSAKGLLKDLATKKLLSVDPDKIIGTSFDIFHKNPARQRDLLSNPAQSAVPDQDPPGRGHGGPQGLRDPRQERPICRPDGDLDHGHAPVPDRRAGQGRGRHRGLGGDRDAGHRPGAQRHGGGNLAPVADRGRGLGAGDRQRADRGLGDRGAVRLDPRDRPPGRRIHHRRRQRRRARPSAPTRPGAGPGRGGAEDRRGGEADQRHRRPDQPAGAQRHHRGGARRRGRQGLRRGRVRGEEPGQPDRQGDRGDRRPDRADPGRDRRVGRGDPAAIGETIGEIERDRHRHRRGGRGAGRGDAGDRPQRAAGRGRHPAGLLQHHRRQRGRRPRPAARSNQVLDAAGELARQSDTLRGEVEGFLDYLKSA